jgi:hypothetical protein
MPSDANAQIFMVPADQEEPRKMNRAYIKRQETMEGTIVVTSKDVTYTMPREMVQCFFDLPAVDAGRILKVCNTVLKKLRKRLGLPHWPYNRIRQGDFKLSRCEIVEMRRAWIQRLEEGASSKFPGVLPLLREAETLSKVFMSICSPTKYALEARVASEALKTQMSLTSKPRPVGNVMAAKVVTNVFKKPVLRQREKWVSSGAMCLSDSEAIVLSDKEAAVDKDVEQQPTIICPLTYAKECTQPAWLEPMYPPVSEIIDGVDAFWPVMDDPRRIWMQEMIVRSLVPNQCGPGISVSDLVLSEPVSAAEMQFVDGFLAEDD